MRIAVVTPTVDKQHGTERAVAELIERLVANHQDQIELYSQQTADLKAQSSSNPAATGAGSIRLHRVKSFPGPHLFRFLAWLLLNRRVRKRWPTSDGAKPEVVFSPGINAFDADVILVHVVFHRVAELQSARGGFGIRAGHRKLYYALLCSLENRIYRNRAVKLAAVSPHTAHQLAHYFGRNDVAVIPNGVDSEHFHPVAIAALREHSRAELKCAATDCMVVLIGNDWRNKGLGTLLSAFAQCADLPIRLLVVGQDDRAPFQSLAVNLGLADRVQFCSPVTDIRNIYAVADMLVAPSLEDSFNLPALEAMSCGVPVIVSARAGISAWLTDERDTLLLRDPENPVELAKAIHRLATDPAIRKAIAANGLETAKQFSWDVHARELRKLLAAAAREKALRAR
jgi:UDP-glucose:(heptosyl)LPS alpha-1,3-glucosyltransferase